MVEVTEEMVEAFKAAQATEPVSTDSSFDHSIRWALAAVAPLLSQAAEGWRNAVIEECAARLEALAANQYFKEWREAELDSAYILRALKSPPAQPQGKG